MGLYAVNGKEPIGVWCPSRDDIGNGTSTVYDLAGSINGTMNGTAPGIGWVVDAGSGGVRAVYFGNTYKSVEIPAFASATTAWSISWWQKYDSISGFPVMVSFADGAVYFHVPYSTSLTYYNTRPTLRPTVSLTAGAWAHVIIVETGSVGKLYVNGSYVADFTGGSAGSINSRKLSIGRQDIANGTFNGRFDDLRVFGTTLDATDAAYLYNSNSGRGRLSQSSDFDLLGMFGGISGAMTGGMAS